MDSEITKVLDQIFTEDQLDNLIKTSWDNFPKLEVFLDIKLMRMRERSTPGVNFRLQHIYGQESTNNIDIHSKCRVLTKLLQVQATYSELNKALENLVDRFRSNDECKVLFENMILLKTVLNFIKSLNYPTINSKFVTVEMSEVIENCLSSILAEPTYKKLSAFTLNDFLPIYLQLKPKFMETLLELVYDTQKLDIICNLCDEFSHNTWDLLSKDRFFTLLSDCLTSRDHYLQKQAIFLLSKSIDRRIPSDFLNGATELAWKNFFILIDASNEKQLHLIEPCLNLLNSIGVLHRIWQVTLYKILLNHTQSSVVYTVATHILINSDWDTFQDSYGSFLCAVNRNDFPSKSDNIFTSLRLYSCKLEHDQYKVFIEESLSINWCSTAFWLFYSHSLQPVVLDESIFEQLLNKCNAIPDLYIRYACVHLCVDNFRKNPVKKFDTFITIARILHDYYDISELKKFLWETRNCIALKWCKECSKNLEIINLTNQRILRVQLLILKEFNYVSTIRRIELDEPLIADLVFAITDIDMSRCTEYLLCRIDHLKDNEDISTFLDLLQSNNYKTGSLLAKASKMIQNFNDLSTNQKLVTLTILKRDNNEDLVNICIKKVAKTRKVDEKVACLLTELLFKYFTENDDDKHALYLTFLRQIIDSQSDALFIIFENIDNIMKHAGKFTGNAIDFLDEVFDQLLKIGKNNLFKKMVEVTYERLIMSQNDEINDKILKLTQNLMESDKFDSCAFIISRKIHEITSLRENNCHKFIPLIVKLILWGHTINKKERVDYCIHQEIYYASSNGEPANNPNFKNMSVRFFAINAMLNLVEIHNSTADEFTQIFIEKYLEYFSKRYFPDSQVHLQKLRIVQAFLLLSDKIKGEKTKLVDLIMDSFLMESHQPSVKHLMQWLLITLLKNVKIGFQLVGDKLRAANLSRPSSVTSFIPVLYNLAKLSNNKLIFDDAINIFLPFSMGAQFKLRVFSQAAIKKISSNDHKAINDAVNSVIEASGDAFRDTIDLQHDFLDYFPLNIIDFSTIYYTIPQLYGVARFEWENLHLIAPCKGSKVKFTHRLSNDQIASLLPQAEDSIYETCTNTNNVQKKITPWRGNLEENASDTSDFILVTSLIEKSTNLGGLSRTCEVFGVKSVVMRTGKIVSDKEFKSLSMSSENWLNIIEVKPEDLKDYLNQVKTKGYTAIGAEQTSQSTKIDGFKFPKKTVLVLGNEKEGIPPNVISTLDYCVEIPQQGVVRSLNVHVAGAIIIWEYCKQHF